MICKIELHGGQAYVFTGPDKPAYLVVPAHLVERRFRKGETFGWFDVKDSAVRGRDKEGKEYKNPGTITEIGDRVEKPKDWP